MTKDDLIAFEADISACFERGEIKAPVHLAGGNEDQLIGLFEAIKPTDWILCSWRSHYHCLLKGVPPAEVKSAILAGRSIALCFPSHRVLSSAIVGGIAPIALGLAWAIKRGGGSERVYCFLGDMTAECGLIHECQKYALHNRLPVEWIVEDNSIGGAGVPTHELWGPAMLWIESRYTYEMTVPFVGIGRHITL